MRTLYFTEKDLASRLKEWRCRSWQMIEQDALGFKKMLIEKSLEVEFAEAIGAHTYQRTGNRKGYRNGHYFRDFQTKKERIRGIRIPKGIVGGYRFRLWDRFQRYGKEFCEAVCQGFLLGLSDRGSREYLKKFYGEDVLSQQKVSQIFQELSHDLERWQQRPIDDDYQYLFLDGKVVRVRGVGKRKKVVLLAMGIKPDGTKEILGFMLARSESAMAWGQLLNGLRERGLKGSHLKLIIHDGAPGILESLTWVWPRVLSQTCAVHHLRNLAKRVNRSTRKKLLIEASRIYEAPHLEAAQARAQRFEKRWKYCEPQAVRTFIKNLDPTLNFYRLAWEKGRSKESRMELWRSLKSTNVLERYIEEIERRIRPMRCFRNEPSCERAIFGIIQIQDLKKRRLLSLCHLSMSEEVLT